MEDQPNMADRVGGGRGLKNEKMHVTGPQRLLLHFTTAALGTRSRLAENIW